MANQLSANNIQKLQRLGIPEKLFNLHKTVKLTRNIKQYKDLMERIENHKRAMKLSYKLMYTALRKMMEKHQAPRYPGYPDPSFRYQRIGFPGPFQHGPVEISPNNVRRLITTPQNQNVEMFVNHYNKHKKLSANIQRLGQELLVLSRQLIRNAGHNVPHNNAGVLQRANNLFYEINVNRGRKLRNRVARAFFKRPESAPATKRARRV